MSSTSFESSADTGSGAEPASVDAHPQSRAATYRLPPKPIISIIRTYHDARPCNGRIILCLEHQE